MSKYYDKLVWYNFKTKLSAKNMNHIEDGIEAVAEAVEYIEQHSSYHTHENKEILDQITAPFTTELKTKYDGDTAVSVSPFGTAENSVQYITIDGVEYKLAGSDLPYHEVSNTSLNILIEPGIYSITDALDVPSNTSVNGILTVNQLTDTSILQRWDSTTNTAQRIYTPGEPPVSNVFTVNGREVPQGTVQLAAGDTYELQGNLIGHIVIGNHEETINNRTKIILKGVNILSDTLAAIEYTTNDKKLIVEIDNNTENYILIGLEGESSQNDPGAIDSENGLVITGVGYLTIKNPVGHGFKASELYVDGNPHIYVDANHDAFHGKNLLKVTNGYFYIADCNDAFAAGHDDPTDRGDLLILGGEFEIIKTKEAAFESRSSSAVKKVLNSTIHFGEEVTNPYDDHGADIPMKFYRGLNNITGATISEVDPDVDFGSARIIFDGETLAPDTNNVFTLAGTAKKGESYKISGDFSNYRIVTQPSLAGEYINVELFNVYYKNNTTVAPFISHSSTQSRIKIKTTENCVTYIEKSNGNIIESGKGIQITSKGDVIIRGNDTATCGLCAPNSYVLLSGDGMRSITGCDMGIYANNVRLGEDPEDIIDAKYSISDDPIYILGNTVDIKITAGGTQPDYNGKIIATQYHTGISLLGLIAKDEEASVAIEAQSGQVIQDAGNSYANSAILYASANDFPKTNVKTYIPPVGVRPNIPPIVEQSAVDTTTTSWVVYTGDGYTKEEADARFVSKEAYDALKAELDERAPKKISIINYVEDQSKTDHRPIKDHAYCPVDIAGETVYVADSIEVFRYACPERIDIDDAPETHGDYIKDGRPMYARDGDFGYPEIDRTGQFNFRPVWNHSGYVLIPDGITPADGYKNFKTQWNIGIPGMYRLTKVSKDLTLDLHAVKESDMPAHIITYKLRAPADYPIEKLPVISIFRCADHCEKYVKYGPGASLQGAYNTLDESLIDSYHLALPETYETVEIDGELYNV